MAMAIQTLQSQTLFLGHINSAGDGAGTFQSPTNYGVGKTNPSISHLRRFQNGDGKHLARANYSSSDVSILVKQRRWHVSVTANFLSGLNPNSVAAGRF